MFKMHHINWSFFSSLGAVARFSKSKSLSFLALRWFFRSNFGSTEMGGWLNPLEQSLFTDRFYDQKRLFDSWGVQGVQTSGRFYYIKGGKKQHKTTTHLSGSSWPCFCFIHNCIVKWAVVHFLWNLVVPYQSWYCMWDTIFEYACLFYILYTYMCM